MTDSGNAAGTRGAKRTIWVDGPRVHPAPGLGPPARGELAEASATLLSPGASAHILIMCTFVYEVTEGCQVTGAL